MDDSQFDQCKKTVIIFAAITAGITLLIATTGSYYLYDIFSTRSEDLTQTTFMSARIIVHGLWTIVPFGLWFCLMEFFRENQKDHTLLYGAIAMLIALSMIVNLTRFMLLALAINLLFIAAASFIVLPGHIAKRIYKFVLIMAIVAMTTAFSSADLHSGWMGRYEETLAGGSIQGRLIRNEYLLTRLTNELPLLGDKDYWSQEAEQSLIIGDPHTVLTVWTSFGVIAALIFAALILAVFIKLLKIYRSRDRYIQESIYEWVFLCTLYIQLHLTMVAGDYLFTVTAFVLVLFLANVDRLTKRTTDATQS